MKLVKSKVKLPYNEMDKEMIEICEFFNTLPGVETKYCCSGHGEKQTYLYFKCSKKSTLARIIHVFSGISSGPFIDLKFLCKWDFKPTLVLSDKYIVENEDGSRSYSKDAFDDIGWMITSIKSFKKKDMIDNINEMMNRVKEIFKDKYDDLFEIK